jgi:hypothetical protein
MMMRATWSKRTSKRAISKSGSVCRGFQFQKRSQLFIRVHNETLSVVAVGVCNPERSPVGINR